MKKIGYIFGIILALFVMTNNAVAQCDVTSYTSKCVEKLKPQSYRFVKSYKVDFQKGKVNDVEYSYVFSRGNVYLITLSNGDAKTQGLRFTLLDTDKKPLVSSYNDENKQYSSAVQLRCQRTGVYYLKYTHEKTTNFCGASVIGMKRQ